MALAGALGATSFATAEESTVHLNVHSGPSTGSPVTDVLSPGEHVDVARRSGSWCYLDKAGADGWAVCSYLVSDYQQNGRWVRGDANGRNDRNSRDERSSRDQRRDVSIGFSIPGFQFSVGPGGFDYGRGPGRSHDNGMVCFYQNHNFNGRSLCMRPGQAYARLHTWNDKISSVRVVGDVQARVCKNWDFGNPCTTITKSDRNLGSNDNVISSIRVTDARGNGNGHANGQVCFYQNKHFTGRSLCVKPGHGYAKLSSWNDKISSIRVSGGAEALVCQDWNYNSRCVTIDRNVADLGTGNDQISSLKVR